MEPQANSDRRRLPGCGHPRWRQAEQALKTGARLALISNLVPKSDRDNIAAIISSASPDTQRMAFEAWDPSPDHGVVLPRPLDPTSLLRSVGAALMNQHQHPEIQSRYFLYVNRLRTFTHVSDGVCELTGFRREEIVGRPIEWLRYQDGGKVAGQFRDLLHSRKLTGSYLLRSKSGEPIPVRFEATILSDGCLCSQLTPD